MSSVRNALFELAFEDYCGYYIWPTLCEAWVCYISYSYAGPVMPNLNGELFL
jgi:hypothetical protein